MVLRGEGRPCTLQIPIQAFLTDLEHLWRRSLRDSSTVYLRAGSAQYEVPCTLIVEKPLTHDFPMLYFLLLVDMPAP